ncbi:2-hydroxy-3-oxopropionate reductase [Streptacidiphilus monticola]|uniref:2-hydroxy-3-oxopropionate reductase n=1 Tax=Streptacidiphilus monticola TaxID=2161674 RepID=A0ABW1G7A4_9ACTN
MSSRRIAFIGLGIMGSPMAANLVRAGHTVTGFNLTQPPIDKLVAEGGRGAASIAEAVKDAEVVITMVPADPQVEEVYFGDGGVLDNAPAGALLIDMSSVTPQMSQRVAAAAEERGLRSIDAPVSGGEAGAIEGVLSIMVGGKAEDFAEAKPVLDALGTTVALVGPSGAGQTVKVANQLIVAVNIQACAEAVVFLERSGVDLDVALDVLNGGLAGSTVLTRKKQNFVNRDFAPGFRIDLHHKDLGNLLSAARAVGAPLPTASLVADFITALRAAGDGGLDHSALLRNLERLSGKVN